MQTLNDIIAEFHRKQTEMSALMMLMEEQIKARDQEIAKLKVEWEMPKAATAEK